MAWALSLGGEDAKAAEAFAEVLKKYPQSPRVAEAEYNAGELAAKAKDYAKALPHYYAAQEKAGRAEPAEKAPSSSAGATTSKATSAMPLESFQYQRYAFPQGPLAGEAAYLEAESLFRGQQYAEALTAYGRWKTFPSPDEQAQGLLHAAEAAGRLKQWASRWIGPRNASSSFPPCPRRRRPFSNRAGPSRTWARPPRRWPSTSR